MQVGSYTILRELGEGGMGKVYLAQHVHTGRIAVLKSLLPQYAQNEKVVQRFYQEGKVLAQLSHPAIVQLYDFFVEQGIPYLVMEYVEGEPLDALLERIRKPLAWEWILRKMTPILQALAYVHSQGVIHRDLKPSNIMIIPKGGAKLLDFGIAKAMDVDLKLTQTGTQVGTALYMAPEQIRGEPVSPRADLYAMGLILYQCAFGRYPWAYEGKTQFEIYQMLLTEPPPIPEWATPAERRFFERALAKRPGERFRSAEEMLEALKEVVQPAKLEPSSSQSAPQPRPEQVSPSTTPPLSEPAPEKPTSNSPQPEKLEHNQSTNKKSEKVGISTIITQVVLMIKAIIALFFLASWVFEPLGMLSWIFLVISFLGLGIWGGLKWRKVGRFFVGLGLASLLYLHFIAWPYLKRKFEKSEKIYEYINEELIKYKANFEIERYEHEAELEIEPLTPPAEIENKFLSRTANLALGPSLRVLFLREPDLSEGEDGKLYRREDTLTVEGSVSYTEWTPTSETDWFIEPCLEYGYGRAWSRYVKKRKYLKRRCKRDELIKISYRYSSDPAKQQSQVDKHPLSDWDCSVISYQWRVERREPCE